MPVKNTIFKASAGTGKTHQVTSLYNALIFGTPFPAGDEDGIAHGSIFPGGQAGKVDCQKILMLTFAKPAAAEMRIRIVNKVEAALAEDTGEHQQEYWRILRSLSGAHISTIHSFAQKLLMENAVTAGISPSVRLVEDNEKKEIFEELAERILLDELKGGVPGIRSWLAEMCFGRDTKNIITAAAGLVDACREHGQDIAACNTDECAAPAAQPSRKDLAGLCDRVRESIDIHISSGKGCEQGAAFCRESRAALAGIGEEADAVSVSALAAKILRMIRGNWGKNMTEVKNVAVAELTEMAAYLASLQMKALLQYAGKCARQYRQRKDELGMIDYADMISRTVDLIKNNADNDMLPPFEVIIVDEAQDNSPIQNELIMLIQRKTRAAVILCGDSKQSIYTWRAADPEGMDKIATGLEDLLQLPLRKSYRSQKDLIAWINSISAHEKVLDGTYTGDHVLKPHNAAMDTSGPNVELLLPDWEYNESIEEQAVTRRAREPEPGTREKRKEEERKYIFELARKDLSTLAEGSNDDSDKWKKYIEIYGDRLVLEARAIARRITLLCREDTPPGWLPSSRWNDKLNLWEENTVNKHYRYRDVLILLRAATYQGLYEAALKEAGIRYTTSGKGQGFFFRQEVQDIVSLVQWLASPKNEIALLAVLRSPFVSLSDNAIAILSSNPEKNSIAGWRLGRAMLPDEEEKMGVIKRMQEKGLSQDAEAYTRALGLLSMLRKLAGRASAIKLVRSAIQQTGYDAVITGGFHGVQKLANMRKLLSIIHETERRENMDLQSLALWLTEAVQSQQIPDAVVFDPEDDAVRISTVHSAKGLTSPVLVIPDLRRSPKNDGNWIRIHEDEENQYLKIAAKIRTADETGESREIETLDYAQAAKTNSEMRDAEARRLFYVGITRPRDLLILSGENPAKTAGAWREWINEHIKSMITAGDKTQIEKLIKIRPYSRVSEAYRKLKPGNQGDITPPSPGDITAAENAVAAATIPAEYRVPVTVLNKIPQKPRNADRQAEEDYGKAILEYRQTSWVGIAPAWINHLNENDENSAVNYAERGTAGHAVLEHFDFRNNSNIEQRVKGALAIAGMDNKKSRLEAGLVEAVEKLCSELTDAGIIIRELPFCAKFESDGATCYVDGKIDILYFKDGIWHIADYKFSDAQKPDLLKHYSLQLLVYRSAISRAGSGGLRKILLKEADSTARVCMKIMGIAADGRFTVTEVDDTPTDSEVAAMVLAAARTCTLS